ncbi:hypothetical protein P171DRAFT_491261 [Karstenula rhodostoma CBS 690.94]|uniref:Uncharacterized protein n=1 Tax=Karstenula rhodostoma CBS 690.94 TaxID=1392251 RepID=A0A9P4P8D6_9PLEO|nr:hypothetical protein P171DRAFT_491261 [Karstenula rhodostoma CBS 690.94]
MGRRLSTPLANYRPHTAPPHPNSVTFRPIRWEFRVDTTGSSVAGSKAPCPYDPKVIQFFDNFEASTSFCGLGSGLPWSTKQQFPTPCDDCLQGTERAHINVSPSRFARGRSRTQQRRSSTRDANKDATPNRPVEQVSTDLRNSHPRRARTPQPLWQTSLQASRTWNPSPRPPERMGHRPDSPSETFNHLVQVVFNAATRRFEPSIPPPRLHQLSPDISYIHRSEVVAHQAAIRTGRHSPVLEHQARGRTPIDVVGYTYAPGHRDSSATALYSESRIPGAYMPPAPREMPSPTRVRSPFRRESISLAPVERPVLVSRLDQPPFVPALPVGTVLRPVREWARASSAPETHWESVLRHSAVYRAREEGYSPRVPSPLHEQHGAESFGGGSGSSEGRWSHGTMPDEGGNGGELGRGMVNGVGKGPRLRGGAGREDYFSLPVRGDVGLYQQWSPEDEGDGTDLDERQQPDGYFHCKVLPEGYKLDTCMRPTAEMPRLRGGGKHEHSRVPASLFYLAGATGRKPDESITVGAWNSMKPKKRTGGLLGMAMYGYKGGKSHIPKMRSEEAHTEPEPAASVTVGVEVSAGSQAMGSARAVSPAPTPGPETSQDGNEASRTEETPSPKDEGTPDQVAGRDAGEPSNKAAEPVPDRPPTSAGDDVANDAPAAASPEPAAKSPTVDDTSTSEAKVSPAAEATPTATPGNTAEDTLKSGPGDAPLPYPTTPSDTDASGKKDVTLDNKPVQMPLTPEELVDKVVEEMRRKGLVA